MPRPLLPILALGVTVALVPAAAGALTVEEGDTLSELTEKHYGSADWSLIEAVAYHNAIADPNLIYVGQEIAFPELSTHDSRVEEPEHTPGTDWDGDGVIEPEPGTEAEETYVSETFDADETDLEPEVSFDYGMWEPIIQCESGGNWYIDSTFDGGLQFHPDTWRGYGGEQYAPYAYQAEPWQQIDIAERVLAGQGWGAWPSCAAQAGYL